MPIRKQQLVSLPERKKQSGSEVLMNMELAMSRSPEVEVSAKLIEPESR
jgi:hypothetical protein